MSCRFPAMGKIGPPKSRAEIQRAYRERKKLNEGEAYSKEESARVMYYTPAANLSRAEHRKRRAKNSEAVKRYRKKTKMSPREKFGSDRNERGTHPDSSLEGAVH